MSGPGHVEVQGAGGVTHPRATCGEEGYPPWYPQGTWMPPQPNRGKVSNPIQELQPPVCPGYSGKDVTSCQLHFGTVKEVYLVSLYCDIDINTVPQELINLLDDKKGVTSL